MSYGDPFNSPYNQSSTAASLEVPGLLPVAIAGRAYKAMLDQIVLKSLPWVREQSDDSEEPGEETLSPLDLWRRARSTWHLGAGQEWADLHDSVRQRFRITKGFDPWTRGKLQLLPDTIQKRASAEASQLLATVGSRLYFVKGAVLEFTTDLTAWTAVTGLPNAPLGIASDGFNVYTIHGASGIYKTDRASGASASFNTRVANGIAAYVKGRLIISNDNVLVNVTGAAAETILLTHPNTDFRWVGAAEGTGHIYAAGFSGDKSLIYRTAVKADGTALDAPVQAGELPDGEIVRSIQGYLGFIVVGTDLGWRFAAASESGDLTFGALVKTSKAVKAFEAQDRFIRFGYTDYDAVSTGLGRIDLTHFTQPLVPAYASDLMVTGQGVVTSIVTFLNKPVFAIAGLGVYTEDVNKVAEAEIRQGRVTLRTTVQKVFEFLDLTFEPAPAGVKVTGQADIDGTPTAISERTAIGTSLRYDLGSVVGQYSEPVVLVKRGTDATQGLVLLGLTLRATPVPKRGEAIVVPLLLQESLLLAGDYPRRRDTFTEYSVLKFHENEGRPILCQIGQHTFEAVIDDVQMGPGLEWATESKWLQGICRVTLRRFAG
jgi:hypothetical protein